MNYKQQIELLRESTKILTRQVNSLDASLRSIRQYALSEKFMGSLENELIHKSDIIRMVDEALNPFFQEQEDVSNASKSDLPL